MYVYDINCHIGDGTYVVFQMSLNFNVIYYTMNHRRVQKQILIKGIIIILFQSNN